MRKKESELLRVTFERDLGMNLVMVDARERFLARLAGVEDPEEKRRIIGDEFIRVFEEEAAKLGRIDFLTQGTLYPDVIESATSETKAAQKIKTHHNVGGLPADLRFQLIEPLRYLFKDEVRRVGARAGAARGDGPAPAVPGSRPRHPDHRRGHRRAARHPARGGLDRHRRDQGAPGCTAACGSVRDPDAGPLASGVMGDGRTYANVVAIRAVTSEDGMTADWAKLPVRRARQDLVADRQRGPGRQPGRLRHQLQAAGDDRMGVSVAVPKRP